MKQFALLFLLIFSIFISSAQDFSGQWKGSFVDKSTAIGGFGGEACDYVLELECRGTVVSGASYTYFTDAGKKYYTICKLEGFIDRKKKFVEVTEIKRTKTNVPVHIRNCFQVHRLSYQKLGDSALLKGSWEPAPEQDGDCGIGTTMLVRRELKAIVAGYQAGIAKQSLRGGSHSPIANARSSVVQNKITGPNALKKDKQPAASARTNLPKAKQILSDSASANSIQSPAALSGPPLAFQTRNTTILKTINVVHSRVKVDLYDNGEIDGDSVSLFYNGRLLMSSKKLSAQPLTFDLDVEEDEINQLVMYAENLGTIPPNTALMVVTDGNKRYEVRITSDLQKSGVINFVREDTFHKASPQH